MNILYDMMIRSKKCEKNRRKKLFRFYIYKIIYPIIYLSLLIRTDLQLRRLWLRRGRRWWGCPGESQNFKRVQPSAYNTPSELLTPEKPNEPSAFFGPPILSKKSRITEGYMDMLPIFLQLPCVGRDLNAVSKI